MQGLAPPRWGWLSCRTLDSQGCQLGQEGFACQWQLIPQIFKPSGARHTRCCLCQTLLSLLPVAWLSCGFWGCSVGRGVLLPVRVSGCVQQTPVS